jgi:ketosteroid isomerase-like protein
MPDDTSALTANHTLVRSLYAAFAKGDVETVLQSLAADVVWSEPDNPFNPAAGTRHGRSGVLEWLRLGHESEEILSLEPRQFLSGNDIVAVVGHMRCRARATGREYESDFVHLVTLRNGLITRFQEFFDTYAAAEAFRTNG